ncbi:hypothetical protein EMIHUDRAFT_211953 [Emiliania huxleyi CCMP1516]|uniref:CUB domain-containing protein n=2 Tax=Emiliania huxleyi TaxID=2903 RepID=A0A0D3IRZ5_EMIH1|nr:hypothetical protein EMIHUDRAFT_211953 [Emiliania huxleyi CCMP1516]EOD14030.1 hypothetical protein EMIHUDRAFT_211953 [Emiliania huxleyi CCMP1516]|eukprot:XP_005766459.1 hypothetical protein EMIHUDRAFT_211953 [Emiliania huxleyi CCMP1516]
MQILAMQLLFLLPNGGVAVCNNSRYGTLAGDPFRKAIHHDNQLLRTNTVDDDLDPVWTSGKCSGYFSAADISEGGPALTAVTSVPTTSKLSGAYAELASFVETSGATKIGDPSPEASFTTVTALSAASLLFLHPCAAVLALLAACRGLVRRLQVKKKRDASGSQAAPPSAPPIAPPLIAPPSLPACPFGDVCTSGPCLITDGGSCATSPDFPNDYPVNEGCIIYGLPQAGLDVIAFDVEFGGLTYEGYCPYDYLIVNGVSYCGTSGPAGVVPSDGNITWGEAFDGLRNATHLDWQVTYTHRGYVFPKGRDVMRMHMGLRAYA